MKVGKLAVDLLRLSILKDIKKRRKNYPPHSFREKIDIPYLNDDDKYHTYDVYLANEENRKHCCVIDIHGGAYIFGQHQDNYPYAYVLLQNGYDVVLVDYHPNEGKRDTSDLVKDLASNFIHLVNHLKKCDLQDDKFVIAGDSAGGHFALLLSEAIINKEVASLIEIPPIELDIIATVVNSPVYDFENMNKSQLSNSGLKRMLGPKYKDIERLKRYSPKTYLDKLTRPIFLSTCKLDFVRYQSLMLYEDLKDRKDFTFVDIDSNNKAVDHVHNVTKINLEESKQVNNKIVEFIDQYLSINNR